MVVTDLKLQYRNKWLGVLWTILDPLMMMVVYVIVVVVIFGQSNPRYPAEIFTALISWRWFNQTVSRSAGGITGKARLIQTVAFPKVLIPISSALEGLVTYGFGLLALVPILFVFKATLTIQLLWLPVIVAAQLLFTLGVAMAVAAVGVYFLDLENLLTFGLRMWWYLSPGMYAVENRIPDAYRWLFMLNPFSGLFISYKNVLVYGLPPSPYVVIAPALGIIMIVIGLRAYVKLDASFAKEV
jgi:ABC-type polysaccharide/polyol phosphate export permease